MRKPKNPEHEHHTIKCDFHNWSSIEKTAKGGRTFYPGMVRASRGSSIPVSLDIDLIGLPHDESQMFTMTFDLKEAKKLRDHLIDILAS